MVISDPSITKSNHLHVIPDEDKIDTFFGIENEFESEEDNDKSLNLGTLPICLKDEGKRYKIVVAKDVSKVCGAVMSQGTLFCCDKS